MRLVYVNNSPDQLGRLMFHLYQNAYQPGSNMDKVYRTRGNYSIAGLAPEEQGYTEIEDIFDEERNTLRIRVDDTIGWVQLADTLLPGDSVVLHMTFKTKFSSIRHRLQYSQDQWGNMQFDVAQWYPKIGVYDRYGWHPDQHIGYEFYGEFGTFDVSITLPEHYIVGATGVLVNREEVLPRALRRKLDIRNFAEKPYGERPSVIIPPSTRLKTWIYHAENVHDFAWIADPTFRIGHARWEDVDIWSYAREWKASRWQDAAEFTRAVIELYSKDIGRYAYPSMIVSDVDQGMEYPMLTMDGGESPGYKGLLAHEVGHNWFYGMVGNNETQCAWLDEGFTSFLTTWAMERLVGKTITHRSNWYEETFYPDDDWRSPRYRRYLDVIRSGYDESINTPSNESSEPVAYRNSAYDKPYVMLFNLQYLLGDVEFLRAMQHYFAKWKFKHPYPEDFVKAIEESSGRDLSWFFDEWLNSRKQCDYGITSVRTQWVLTEAGRKIRCKIALYRYGDMIMPLDIVVTLADSTKLKYLIPVDNFIKVEEGLDILPMWPGWDDVNRTYTAEIELPAEPISVEIDPSLRLADVDRLDNTSGFLPKIKWEPDNYMGVQFDPLDTYLVRYRPDLRFNNVDGIALGIALEGGYLMSLHQPKYRIYASSLAGTRTGAIDFMLGFRLPLSFPTSLSGFFGEYKSYEGRELVRIGLDTRWSRRLQFPPFFSARLFFQSYELRDSTYILFARYNWMKERQTVSTINLVLNWSDRLHWFETSSTLTLSTNFLHSDYSFGRLTFETNNKFPLPLGATLNTRLYYGYSNDRLPPQEAYRLAGGNPMQEFEHFFYASPGTLPVALKREGHIRMPGGGNLRGYSNQDVSGSRIFALNFELYVPMIWKILTPTTKVFRKYFNVTPYGFYDFGNIESAPFYFSSLTSGLIVDKRWAFFPHAFYHDLGVGILWPLPFPAGAGRYNLRLEIPFWVNLPRYGEKRGKFRWVVGIEKAF